jgi:hypothetical protein
MADSGPAAWWLICRSHSKMLQKEMEVLSICRSQKLDGRIDLVIKFAVGELEELILIGGKPFGLDGQEHLALLEFEALVLSPLHLALLRR